MTGVWYVTLAVGAAALAMLTAGELGVGCGRIRTPDGVAVSLLDIQIPPERCKEGET